MRRRVSPDVLLVLAALSSVAVLHGLAHHLQPPVVGVGEAAAREGERVSLDVRVLKVSHGPRGRVLELADDDHRIRALAGPGEGPARGDLVRVVAMVTRLDEGPGLSIERLDVLEPAATRALDPGTLARRPAAYEGARVLVAGEVRGNELVGGGARIRLAGEPPPDAGSWLAAGAWSYQERHGAYALRVDTWTRPWSS